jgi:microcystin-dependent protein
MKKRILIVVVPSILLIGVVAALIVSQFSGRLPAEAQDVLDSYLAEIPGEVTLAAVSYARDYEQFTADMGHAIIISPADPPLLPRQSILPSFFAKDSADSRLLEGYDWSPLFGTNNPADGTLLDSKIRDGSINANKLAPQSIHSGLLASNAVTVSTLAQEVLDLIVPAGSIIAFGGAPENVPGGWMLCDGRNMSSAQYPRLFSAIGTAWGIGFNDTDSATDFNLPDLRGRFLRGVTGTTSRDPDAAQRTEDAFGGNTGNAVGSTQTDAFDSHTHRISISGNTAFDGVHTHVVERTDGIDIRWGDGGGSSSDRIDAADSEGSDPTKIQAAAAGNHRHAFTVSGFSDGRGGNETRPENAYVNYIIKY